MAWQSSYGKRAFRKEGSAAMRGNATRDVLSAETQEPHFRGKRKRAAACNREFGIEIRYKKRIFSFEPKGWRSWGWYETEKQRDQALAALTKHRAYYDLRPVQRAMKPREDGEGVARDMTSKVLP